MRVCRSPDCPNLLLLPSCEFGMKPLLYSLKGDVGIITMNNDARRNVLSEAFFQQLIELLDTYTENRVRAVILRANPGAHVWSAGHDVNELPPAGQDPLCWAEILPSMTRALHNFPAPVIAMIEGSVWGGACELALACDIVVAATGTTFALTPARLGVPYNINGLSTFTRSLTPQLLKELLFTAAPMPAERLASAGAINHVVPTAALESFCISMAEQIQSNAPLTIRATKEMINVLLSAREMSASEFERLEELRKKVYSSVDYAEGLDALRNKRAPEFTGF
jgi:methylmalonyl-CoA decarboxylase